VIRNGVADPLSVTLPLNPFSPSVAMVGRLSQEKGFDEGLRALAIVRERFPNLRIRLVGTGPMTTSLHDVARELDLLDSVDYFGQLENTDAVRVVAGSDLVVIPSKEEGFSLVAVEAALLGRAVVATTAGGLPETVVDGQTGLLVQPGALGDMAESIEYLLSKHELRVEMGKNARLRALDAFGMERFIADISNLYGRIWGPGAEVRQESRS
jgi:glycosyltransferase involved in cell wall biosynthesis